MTTARELIKRHQRLAKAQPTVAQLIANWQRLRVAAQRSSSASS